MNPGSVSGLQVEAGPEAGVGIRQEVGLGIAGRLVRGNEAFELVLIER